MQGDAMRLVSDAHLLLVNVNRDLGHDGRGLSTLTQVQDGNILAALGGVGASSNALSKGQTTVVDQHLAVGAQGASDSADLVSVVQNVGGVPALELGEKLRNHAEVLTCLASGNLDRHDRRATDVHQGDVLTALSGVGRAGNALSEGCSAGVDDGHALRFERAKNRT